LAASVITLRVVSHDRPIALANTSSDCKLVSRIGAAIGAPNQSGSSKAWLKIKNPKAPAATRAIDGTF
jgi:hypothetical protein